MANNKQLLANMYLQQHVELLKRVDEVVADFNEDFLSILDKNIEAVEDTMRNKISPYISIVYEISDFTDNIINNSEKFDKNSHELLLKTFDKIEDLENSINSSLEEIKECTSYEFLKYTYTKMVKEVLRKNGYFNKKIKLYGNKIMEKVSQNAEKLAETSSIYFKEQLDNISIYNDIIFNTHQIKLKYLNYVNGEKEDSELQNVDIKRFACTYDDMIKFLNYKGYFKDRQNGTSHAIYKNESGKSVPIPNKKGDMVYNTALLILRQINSNRNEFGAYLMAQ